MYDINYFTALKKHKQKSQNVRIVFISFLGFLILANAIMLTFGFLANRRLEAHIQQNQSYLNAPATKAKVRDAAILDKELTIAKGYLDIVTKTAEQVEKSSMIKVDLIDHLRGLTPQTTFFESVVYKENSIKLNCMSTVAADPMQFYNKLMHDDRFSNVFMSGFNAENIGTVKFVIELTMNGGVQP